MLQVFRNLRILCKFLTLFLKKKNNCHYLLTFANFFNIIACMGPILIFLLSNHFLLNFNQLNLSQLCLYILFKINISHISLILLVFRLYVYFVCKFHNCIFGLILMLRFCLIVVLINIYASFSNLLVTGFCFRCIKNNLLHICLVQINIWPICLLFIKYRVFRHKLGIKLILNNLLLIH